SEHLPGVEADPDLEWFPSQPFAQSVDGVAHLARRANGTQRVVLMDDRDAEDGHDLVADELLDRSPVPLDNPAHRFEVAGLDTAERLRIAVRQGGRVDEVAEENGDRLADVAWGSAHDRAPASTVPRREF